MASLKKTISEILEMPIEQITDDLNLNSDQIDSFKKLHLITSIEKQFKISLTINEAMAISTVADYAELLHRKGIAKSEI